MNVMANAQLETVACLNCGSREHIVWAVENGFSALKCSDCGLVYVSPRPRADTISEANKIGVHGTAEGDLVVIARRQPGRVAHLAGVAKEMFPEMVAGTKPVHWLDIGCGYGEFVEALSGLLPGGSRVIGIEPMRPKVAAAQRRGLTVDSKTLDEVREQFDVVSLMNVFSHIPNFSEFGTDVAGKIKPGGVLFLETGNGGDLASRREYPDLLNLPDHLVFAGVEQMRAIIGRIGFTVERTMSLPVDGPVRCAKTFVKKLLRGQFDPRLPYTSPFRTVFYKCRKPV